MDSRGPHLAEHDCQRAHAAFLPSQACKGSTCRGAVPGPTPKHLTGLTRLVDPQDAPQAQIWMVLQAQAGSSRTAGSQDVDDSCSGAAGSGRVGLDSRFSKCLRHVQLPQAQDGSDRLGLALQKVLQEDSGALLHRLHKEGDMCMNCDWSRIDLEHSGQVGSGLRTDTALSELGFRARSLGFEALWSPYVNLPWVIGEQHVSAGRKLGQQGGYRP